MNPENLKAELVMDNLYAPPKTQITEFNRLHRWGLLFWLVAIGSSLFSLALGLLGSATPQFADLFAGFGGELPEPTRIVLNHARWLWLPAVAVLLLWFSWARARLENRIRKRLIHLFMTSGIASLLLMAGVLWALSLPRFTFGIAVE